GDRDVVLGIQAVGVAARLALGDGVRAGTQVAEAVGAAAVGGGRLRRDGAQVVGAGQGQRDTRDGRLAGLLQAVVVGVDVDEARGRPGRQLAEVVVGRVGPLQHRALFPYTALFRSGDRDVVLGIQAIEIAARLGLG